MPLDFLESFESVLALVAREAVDIFLADEDILCDVLELFDILMDFVHGFLESLDILNQKHHIVVQGGDLEVSQFNGLVNNILVCFSLDQFVDPGNVKILPDLDHLLIDPKFHVIKFIVHVEVLFVANLLSSGFQL